MSMTSGCPPEARQYHRLERLINADIKRPNSDHANSLSRGFWRYTRYSLAVIRLVMFLPSHFRATSMTIPRRDFKKTDIKSHRFWWSADLETRRQLRKCEHENFTSLLQNTFAIELRLLSLGVISFNCSIRCAPFVMTNMICTRSAIISCD